MTDGERIAKFLARAGVFSRREAERHILDGRVMVNGTVLTSPAFNVTGNEKITVDGVLVKTKEVTRLFLFNKAAGLICTHNDPEKRQSVFDKIKELYPTMPRLVSVGRLDLNSEGLLLLTNSGALASKLESPQEGWKRRYRVRIFGRVTQNDLKRLQKPVIIDGIKYTFAAISIEKSSGANTWLSVTLQEGKNREIRNVFAHFGWSINRLMRTAYGPFQIGNLPKHGLKEVSQKVLIEQLGKTCVL